MHNISNTFLIEVFARSVLHCAEGVHCHWTTTVVRILAHSPYAFRRMKSLPTLQCQLNAVVPISTRYENVYVVTKCIKFCVNKRSVLVKDTGNSLKWGQEGNKCTKFGVSQLSIFYYTRLTIRSLFSFSPSTLFTCILFLCICSNFFLWSFTFFFCPFVFLPFLWSIVTLCLSSFCSFPKSGFCSAHFPFLKRNKTSQ